MDTRHFSHDADECTSLSLIGHDTDSAVCTQPTARHLSRIICLLSTSTARELEIAPGYIIVLNKVLF